MKLAFDYPDLSRLSIQELLSLTLREKLESTVIEELSSRFPSLRDLGSLTYAELTEIKGLGPIKASALLASLELAKRLYSSSASDQPIIIKSPGDVAKLLMPEMRYLDREHFRIILMNTKNHVLTIETVSIGTLSSSIVHPRECFVMAIKKKAASIILVHNHPSGDPTPSKEDQEVTLRLVEVGKLIGIEILDHIIIGDGNFMSLKEKGIF